MFQWFTSGVNRVRNAISPRRDDIPYDMPESDPLVEKIKASPGVVIPYFLPFFDAQQNLGTTQVMQLAFRQMLADPFVKSALLGKLIGVMAMDLRLHTASKSKRDMEIAEFVEWNLVHRLEEGVSGLVWDIFSGGAIDGFSVNEKVWAKEVEQKGKWKGKRPLERLKAKDTMNDLVLEVDQYRNIVGIRALRYNTGEVYSPKDFLIYTHFGLFESPLGMSDFRAGYRAAWMLDTVQKLRAMGAEKRALPAVAGEYTGNAQKSLEAALAKLKSSNWMAVPRDTKLQVLDIAQSAENYFKSFRDDLVEEIFMSIEGAYLHAMAGGQGKHRGDSKMGADRANMFKFHLSVAMQHLLNDRKKGLIVDIVDRNFANVDDYPRATLTSRDVEWLKQEIEICTSLAGLGWQFSPEFLEEKFGMPWAGDRPEFVSMAAMMAQMQPAGDGAGGKPGSPLAAQPRVPSGLPGAGHYIPKKQESQVVNADAA